MNELEVFRREPVYGGESGKELLGYRRFRPSRDQVRLVEGADREYVFTGAQLIRRWQKVKGKAAVKAAKRARRRARAAVQNGRVVSGDRPNA